MSNVSIEFNKMAYLFDPHLTMKAKGMMAMMVAYINKNQPEIFRLEDITETCCNGKFARQQAIKELEEAGYFIRRKGGYGFGGSPWVYTLKE